MLLLVYVLLVNCYFYVDGLDAKIVDIDYYVKGKVKHTRVKLNCDLDLHTQYCRIKCDKSPFACIDGNCFCVREDNTLLNRHNDDGPSYEIGQEIYHRDKQNLKISKSNSDLSRRHHIAHFCPDLEKARKCIKKCMRVGKPAFCGKDHNCYCGHKYKEPGNKWREQNIDVKAVYGQFKDLYAKYFPPQPRFPHKDKQETAANKPAELKLNATTSAPVVGGASTQDPGEEATTTTEVVTTVDPETAPAAEDNGSQAEETTDVPSQDEPTANDPEPIET